MNDNGIGRVCLTLSLLLHHSYCEFNLNAYHREGGGKRGRGDRGTRKKGYTGKTKEAKNESRKEGTQ
jgi:hypothetical protein